MIPDTAPSELRSAFSSLKAHFRLALFYTFFSTLLVIVPAFYMLEVYDRVLNSRNFMTLAMLTLLAIGAYIVLELLEWARSGVMRQAGLSFDTQMHAQVFDTLFEANLHHVPGASARVLIDLQTLRDFLSSQAAVALMEVPLATLYLAAIFLINSTMGYLSIVGALIAIGLTYFTERDTLPLLTGANRSANEATDYANASLRNAQVIEAMGMRRNIHARWVKRQRLFLHQQALASDRAGAYAAASRFVQFAQSSLLLGAGCWLTIEGQFPGGGGMMIVASILGGRLLAPISMLIGMWKYIVNARDAYVRLDNLMRGVRMRPQGMAMPQPKGALSVEAVVAGAPGSAGTIIRGVSFAIPAGNVAAIVGPSAAGKTTLARLLVGVWPAASGKVRLDGVDIFPWNKAELGPHVGYLPQDVELFDGTLAENVARFGHVDKAKVEAAARAVGLHEAVLALPEGYDTVIGDDGCFLSGGQRQRVGLARAIYGNPRYIVLDEPNSSLDETGENALVQMLTALKAQGVTVIVITQRANVLAAADLMLVLHEGQLKAFGPRDEILASLQLRIPAAPVAPPSAAAA
jgi:ATP-binding cassette, subfamily C, bacterial exporter for protease/lipase